MSQSKKDSIKEVVYNTTIGMIGSWLITMACLLYLTTPVSIATSTTILCTVWSVGRGYAMRRYFNNRVVAM